jgi:large subunit ribosomal protein L7/L12
MTDQIIDLLKNLTLLEASQLIEKIEETFNVDASNIGTKGSPINLPSSSEINTTVEEEKTEFDLVLEEVPADKKIAILKVVRTLTGLGLKEAKTLVESAPKVVKEGLSKENAEDMKKQLEEAGGKVNLK